MKITGYDRADVGEQEDATELETLRMKQRLLLNPLDSDANKFFAVLAEYKAAPKPARSPG